MSDETGRLAVVIEDDADVRHLLRTILDRSGFDVVQCENGPEGLDAVRRHDPVLTTLDVNMPGMDGFTVARSIREFSTTYIIMLTGLDDEIDVVHGLDSGADDYLVKPFRPRELRARIDSVLRRPRHVVHAGAPGTVAAPAAEAPAPPPPPPVPPQQQAADAWMRSNGLALNVDARTVVVDGRAVDLTRTEFDLVAALMSTGRRVRSKADLVLTLRGSNFVTTYFVNEADKRAVEVHVANLRRKLGDSDADPRWIEPVRGVGYRMAEAH